MIGTDSGESVFQKLTLERTTDASSFTGCSVIFVKSAFIPPSFSFTNFVSFLRRRAGLHVAALERLNKSYTIAAGYLLPDDVPQRATEILVFFVRQGIRPVFHTASISSSELEEFIHTVSLPTVERYFAGERSLPPPELPKDDSELDTGFSFEDWWASLDSPWHIAPTEYGIPTTDLEVTLDVFQTRILVDTPTEFAKRNIKMANRLLRLPMVDARTRAEIAAHRSLFSNELEEADGRRPRS
jgi:hypothetical protein